jgi:bacillithiol system protein YtxJ
MIHPVNYSKMEYVMLKRTLILSVVIVMIGTLQSTADITAESSRFNPDKRNTPTESWEGPHVKEIFTDADWKKIVEESKTAPVFVFKHSTECPVSAGAAHRTNTWLKSHGKDAPKFYFVKVIERRPVSQKIEKETNLKHESPQLILLQNGKHLWNTSHENITGQAIETAIDEHLSTNTKK